MTASPPPSSTVYGPVKSWRVGKSLGVDLIFTTSACSFRCLYCQLGKIEQPTLERRCFVPTERVMADLEASAWTEADIITLSGSGEPTLASNLGEVIDALHARTGKPVMVLTNATLLNDPTVRAELIRADKVFCKLDAAHDPTLAVVNRPVDGISVESIVKGIELLRAEYRGYLAVQVMFLPQNRSELEDLADLLAHMEPDEVQLNTPMRPVPQGWFLEARGNYEQAPYPAIPLRHLDRAEALAIEEELRARTGLKIVSVFRPEAAGAASPAGGTGGTH